MMDNEYDRGSFQLDPKAKSFWMTGFRWRDAPAWLLARIVLLVLYLGFPIDIAWLLLLVLYLGFIVVVGFGMSFLNSEAQLVIAGMSIGYTARVWIETSCSTAPAKRPSPDTLPESLELSERFKAIADEPERFIEAITVYREESGAGLAEAKVAVEAYIQSASQGK